MASHAPVVEKDFGGLFTIVKPISRGAFGKVYLAYHKKHNRHYAIKVMKKTEMLWKNMADQVRAERDALALQRSAFCVQLFYSLQSTDHVYLVMEYMIGGDLKSLLHQYGRLDEKMARFYVAEIALALDYLHGHGIIHRDVKPDNMLVNRRGHVKLTDFGLSKIILPEETVKLLVRRTKTPSAAADLFARTPGQLNSLTARIGFGSSAKVRKKRKAGELSPLAAQLYNRSGDEYLPLAQGKIDFDASSSLEYFTPPERPDDVFEPWTSAGCFDVHHPAGRSHSSSSVDTIKLHSHTSSLGSSTSTHRCPSVSFAEDGGCDHGRRRSYPPCGEDDKENRHSNHTGVTGEFTHMKLEPTTCHHPPHGGHPGHVLTHAGAVKRRTSYRDVHLLSPIAEAQHAASSAVPRAKISRLSSGSSPAGYSGPPELLASTPVKAGNDLDEESVLRDASVAPPRNMGARSHFFVPHHDFGHRMQNLHSDEDLKFRPVSRVSSHEDDCYMKSGVVADDVFAVSPAAVGTSTSSRRRSLPKTPANVAREDVEGSRILGTPDYLAPELLLRLKHGKPVDWWSLGVCFYEFLNGFPPFNADSAEEIFENVLNLDIPWPEGPEAMSPEAVQALLAMLVLDPSERLQGVREMKSLALFEGINWDKILEEEGPFVPCPDDECDTDYFEGRNRAQNIEVSRVDFSPPLQTS